MLGEEIAPRLTGPDQGLWLDMLEREQDNLRAALRWLLDGRDVERGARLAAALVRFWHFRGDLGEGRAWLERALAAGEVLPPRERIQVLVGAGLIAWQQVDYPRATRYNEEALALARAHGVTQGINDTLVNLGIVAHFEGDFARAQALLGEALAAQREGDNHGALPWTLFHLGLLAISQRAYDQAVSVLDEAVACAQSVDAPMVEAVALIALGLVALHQGLPDQAAPLWTRGLRRVHEFGLKHPTAFGLEVATVAAVQRGVPERAGRLWGARAAVHESLHVALSPSEHAQYDPYVDRARAQIGDACWATALAEGRAMTLDQAVTYALTNGDT
jgi:tetratricopeptide (TPR) repeat protein